MKTMTLKIFSFVMMVLILVASLPIYAFAELTAAEGNETEAETTEDVSTEKQEITVLEEDTSLRSENIKHFKLSDGTTKAVVYSQAVHYLDSDGKWVDIDNALTLSGSEYSSNNKQSIKFANKSGSNGLVSIKDGEYKIVFTPLNTNKVSVEIENPQSNNSRKFEDMSVLNNLVSKAVYADIYDGIDIEYILVGNNIKENIIVKEKQESYTFSFELKLNKLSAELENGAIILCDYDSGEEIYKIPAPYMLDSNNKYSENVEYSLVQNNKWKYTLTVTADAEWINTENRASPVTIDPMVYVDNKYLIYDTYFSNDDTNNFDSTVLAVGDFWSLDCYTFIRCNSLPTIPEGAVVTDAKISMYAQAVNNTDNLNIGAYNVNTNWTESTTHSQAKTYFDSISPIDHVKINGTGVYEWDITETFKQWKSGDIANYGIAFGLLNIGDIYGAFAQFSSAQTTSYTVPMLEVSYVSVIGIEDRFAYFTSSAGMAGTGYVNAFSGNLTFIHNIFETADEILPYSLYATYNSNTKKWMLSIDETVQSLTLYGTQCYKWTDSDGTEHWFTPIMLKNPYGAYIEYELSDTGELKSVTEVTKLYDTDGLGLTLTTSNGDVVISDDKGNKKTFTNGKLSKITDTYGNARSFSTNEDGDISISLTPNGETTSIEQIYIENIGSTLVFVNRQNGIRATADYSDENRLIMEDINYSFDNDAYNSINFEYSSDNHLILAKETKSALGNSYTYTNSKVTLITELANVYSETPVSGNSMSVSYSSLSTTGRTAGADNILNTTDDMMSTYRFDGCGRIITAYSCDSYGNIYSSSSYEYNDMYRDSAFSEETARFETDIRKHNSIKSSFVNGASTPNYIYNGSFDVELSSGWINGGSIEDLNSVSIEAINQGKALKLSTNSTVTVKQNVYLPVGKYLLSASILREKMAEEEVFELKIYTDDSTVLKNKSISNSKNENLLANDWERESLSFEITTAGTYIVALEYTASANTTDESCIYVDNVMLESGTGSGVFSIIGNGGFEAEDLISSGSKNAHISTTYVGQGTKALKLMSNLLFEAYFKQEFNISEDFANNSTVVISAWGMADSIPTIYDSKSIANFGIELVIEYANQTSRTEYIPFESDNSRWQYICREINLKHESENTIATKISVICTYDYNVGSAYFDNIGLFYGGTTTNYEYNELGYIEKISDSDGNETNYHYENGNAYDVTSVTDKYGRITSAEYDENHNITGTSYNGTNADSTTASDDVFTEYDRNNFGQIVKTTVKNSTATLKAITGASYISDMSSSAFSKVSTVTDEKGKVTTYKYNDKGLLEVVYYDNAYGIKYLYNAYGQLTSAIPIRYNSSTDTISIIEGNATRVNYVYNDKNQLSQIDANSDYSFTYDAFGNILSFGAGRYTLALYEYVANNGNLKKQTYGNGAYVEYVYDSLDRVIAVCYNGVEKVSYVYSLNGEIFEIKDLDNYITYQYSYDGKGVIQNEKAIRSNQIYYNRSYDYDDNGRITEKRITFPNEANTSSYQIKYSYDDNGLVSRITNTTINLKNEYEYDVLGRNTVNTLSTSTKELSKKSYTYKTVNDNFTSQIYSVNDVINGVSYTTYYTYDTKGNITNILYVSSDSTSKNVYYEYDSQNRLIREDNQLLGYTYKYQYDTGGNLETKLVYTYTRATLSSDLLLYRDVYVMNSSDGWNDLQIGYYRETVSEDGNSLETTYIGGTEYDASGNPLTYYNGTEYAFTWKNGRQLYSVNNGRYVYKYNQDGIRISKHYGSTYVEYILDGTKILYEKTYDLTNSTLTCETLYSYDANGIATGAKVTTYGSTTTTYTLFFKTNIQGDILSIYLIKSGTIIEIVQFNYDAWGNYTTVVKNSALSDMATSCTHLRYRGYYQDAETGFYYLNSRYYDAKMCRFLNADGVISGASGDLQGYNMFAYCCNNPVNMIDQLGNWPKWLSGALNIVSGIAQMAAGSALGAFTSWTGLGAVAAGFLILNGAATFTQGVGQIVNDITGTDALREDNMVRTEVQNIGREIGGDKGAKIAGATYDIATVVAGFYAGKVALQQNGLAPVKVNINSIVSNPYDEFVTVGPADGIISQYCRTIPQFGYGKIYVTQLENGLYQIANGHHRVAALRMLGYETIKVYLTQ